MMPGLENGLGLSLQYWVQHGATVRQIKNTR